MGRTNFNHQVVKDIDFIKSILPDSYKVGESRKFGSIHCISPIGIQDENQWKSIFQKIQQQFKERFREVFHNTCTNHLDFTIHLKP